LSNQRPSLDQLTDAILAASTTTVSEPAPPSSPTHSDNDDNEGIDKLAMSEIEKFRSRQLMRDKELELKRQEKLKEKIIHYEKMKQRGDTTSTASTSVKPPAPPSSATIEQVESRRRYI
jgi:hypothetical protein